MANKQKIFLLLKERGVPIHLNGFEYLLEGIALGVDSPNMLRGMLTKSLYPEIAKRFNTTWLRVERCLRIAIAQSSAPEHTPGSFIKDAVFTLKVEE